MITGASPAIDAHTHACRSVRENQHAATAAIASASGAGIAVVAPTPAAVTTTAADAAPASTTDRHRAASRASAPAEIAPLTSNSSGHSMPVCSPSAAMSTGINRAPR